MPLECGPVRYNPARMREAIIEIIKWIRESVRPVIVLLLMSALALFLPHSRLATIGIADWLQKYRPWVVSAFSGSLIWLITFPVEVEYNRYRGKRYLRQLTEEERSVLKPFILNAKKTQAFAMNVAVARHLVECHVLTESSTTSVRGHIVFVINSVIFSHLMKHPELVGITRNSN